MSRTLTIAYLVRPADGGIKSHMLTLLSGLDRARFAPVLICPPDSSLYAEADPACARKFPMPLVGEVNPVRDTTTAISLRRLLTEVRPDVLHMHSLKAGIVGRLALASMPRRPKSIVTYHSFPFDERVGSRKRAITRAAERALSGRMDSAVAVSEALRDQLVNDLRIPARKMSVIYNGIRFIEIDRRAGDRPTIGTISRLAPQKGVEFFVRAAVLVLTRFPSARFVIVGDGPRMDALVTLAESLGVRGAIDFQGYRKDALDVAARFDVFALTSTWETFGITLVEAMSIGVPVVASRVGGIPEIVDGETTGLLAEPSDPRSIADGICRLLSDRDLALRLSSNGREHVRARFSADRMVGETQALYERICGSEVR